MAYLRVVSEDEFEYEFGICHWIDRIYAKSLCITLHNCGRACSSGAATKPSKLAKNQLVI